MKQRQHGQNQQIWKSDKCGQQQQMQIEKRSDVMEEGDHYLLEAEYDHSGACLEIWKNWKYEKDIPTMEESDVDLPNHDHEQIQLEQENNNEGEGKEVGRNWPCSQGEEATKEDDTYRR